MSEAAERLKDALGLLDRSAAPVHIAAYVDLALCHIREAISGNESQTR
jgi:hypothetical protein